jgi:peptidyl-prolyl cis-trans isomerase SurA
VSGLTACRTSPSVAAYVGDDAQVTVAELDAAVAERLEDPAIAAYAEGAEEDFTRRVLDLLVLEEVYAEAAQRYDVEAGDDDVRARIDQLLGDDDPDTVYGQLAQQGIGREDVFENVRQQLLRLRLAEAVGKAEGLSVEELRARYEEVRENLAEVSFGYITVPDQATADAVVAQLTAAPASYPALAAQYPGSYTLPTLESRSPDELPGVLAQDVAAAAPNTGFTVAVPETGGIVVGFVEGTVYPPFEEVRPQLESEAGEAADAAGAELVDAVRDELGITLNPRFEELKESAVVDLLGDEEPADGAAPPAE